MAASIADEMLLSTVKVEATLAGRPISTGTGFFWGTEVASGFAISLVTNKHVLKGADGFIIHMHCADPANPSQPSGKNIRFNVERHPGGEIPHPEPDVDLIALNISVLLNQAQAGGHTVCFRHLDRNVIPVGDAWDIFDAVEDVYMIGCPSGISDEYNNMPLVRRGITATSVKRDFNGKHEFMIDLACFSGSSGSPIFFINQQSFLSYKQPDGSMKSKPNVALLGILHAGPVINSAGQIVLNQPPKVVVQNMMHLGQVIRSSRILEIDDLISDMAKSQVPPNI